MGDGQRQRPAASGPAGPRQRGRRTAVVVVAGVAALLVVAAVTVARWPGEEEAAVEPGTPEREPDPPAAEDAPTPPADEDAPTPPAPEPAPDVVTEDHDGATLAMSPGDTTALRLSSDWLWEEPEMSGAAVALATVDHLVDPGYAEWQVEAVAAGTSEVTAHGSPNCGDEDACPPRTVTITFAVTGS